MLTKYRSMIIWILLLLSDQATGLDIDGCDAALGMETGEIADQDLSASSSFDESSVGPQNSRIRTEKLGGAWCPKRQIKSDVREWLEIDLRTARVLTAIETQGRYGAGHGLEYAPGYSVEYWRTGMDGWARYKNRTGNEILQANTNTFTSVVRQFDSPFVASKIRIIPWAEYTRTVCIRVELYGCDYAERLLTYGMPQGYKGVDLDFRDKSYDGYEDKRSNGDEEIVLSGGMGQLFDGMIGETNSTNSPYGWVGWNQRVSGIGTWIKIPTNGVAIGRFVKIQLYFASKWLLISEFQFESLPIRGNSSTHHLPSTIKSNEFKKTSRVTDLGQQRIVSVGFDGDRKQRSDTVAMFNLDDMPPAYIGLIVGMSIAIVSICAIIVLLICVRRRRYGPVSTSPVGAHYVPAAYVSSYRNSHMYANGVDSAGIGKDVHVFYATDGSITNRLSSARVFVNNAIESGLLPNSPPPKRPYGGASPPPDYTSSGSNNQAVTDEPSEYADPDSPMLLSSNSDIPLIPPPPTTNKRRGSFRLPAFGSFIGNASESQEIVNRKSQSPCTDSLHYASSDVTTPPREVAEYDWDAATVPSTSSAIGISMVPNENGGSLNEIPRHRLRFREKLGEGEFGEVHLCYLDNTLVAVKLLRKTCDAVSRHDFEKEMHTLVKFDHPNIVRLLGVCTRTEPQYTVVEYMEHGDLNQYLHKCPESLPYNSILHIANQISAGMRYLESLNVVHRDLATRNCLVGDNLTIKIADFGMARSLYSSDYYRIEGKFVLPIRWMAWECILLGKFTPKTDIWAFAVTLWEVFTSARVQPYADLTDEAVIDNLQHIYHCGQLRNYLDQPSNCPQDAYELMLSCWRREDDQRPTFVDVHSFFFRKLVQSEN